MDPDTTGDPPRRAGPRPLALHLATLAMTLGGSLPALAIWSGGLLPWSEPFATAAAGLKDALGAAGPEALAPALRRAILDRLSAFAEGVRRYQTHPHRRPASTRPVVWRDGPISLVDHGVAETPPDAPALLVVPSLVNRAYILDLTPETSFLDHLARAGWRPYLLDWGVPGARERAFDLTGYVTGPLMAAAREVTKRNGRPPAVIGYCMGGLLTLPLALAGLAERLVLLATPWDFHADATLARRAAAALPILAALINRLGVVPVDMLQSAFQALDPNQVPRKFIALGRGKDVAKLTAFVILEDWLNDGVPLAGPVGIECLRDWYVGNLPARGLWRIGGAPVDPGAIACPTLVVAPDHDRIVPAESALALARATPGAESLRVPLGHIGLVAGKAARAVAWDPVTAWLARR